MSNMEIVQREYEAYRRDHAASIAILDRADEEKRSTSAEEDQTWEQLVESAKVHKARADKLLQMDKDSEQLGEAIRSLAGAQSNPGSGAPGAGAPDSSLRVDQRLLEAVTQHLAGLNASANHEAVRAIEFDAAIDEEAVRAIANFSDSGSLYTSDFSTRVAVYARTLSPWLGLAQVINADNGRPLILPKLSADVTGYTPGEGTAITESTPTLGTSTATPVSYKALSYISAETEDDELIGLMQLISQSHGRQLGLDFGSQATTDVLAGATNGGTASGVGGDGTATVAFFGYEDLLDLKYGAAAPYRLVGVWIAANGAIKKIRKFKDGNSQYFWQPAISAGQPDMFDGQPIYEDPNLATPASATKSVVYGDPASYVVKQMPLRLAVSTEFRFNTDQVALKTVYRAGGAVADPPGLRYLVSANT